MAQIADHKIMMSTKNARNSSTRSDAPGTGDSSWITIWQPKDDLKYSFETTYDANTSRSQSGKLPLGALFTVEQLSYEGENIPVAEVSKILKVIAKGKEFWLRYYSLYHNEWRTGLFYVGKGNLTIGSLADNRQKVKNLSFNMTSKWYLDW